MPDNPKNQVIQWEVENSSLKILEWQKHIMRGEQQSKARSSAFKELSSTQALWVRDFAQKVLPSKVT